LDPDSAYHQLLSPLLSTYLSSNAQISLAFIIILLLVLTALIAGSEVAFFSLSAKDINYIKQKEKGNYQTILNLLENPKRLLATLLIGNNFLSIGVIISTNLLFDSLVHIEHLFPQLPPGMISLLSILIQVVLVTFFLVLFGEVLPKVYATQNNLSLCLFTAPFIRFLDTMFGPLSRFLMGSTKYIEKKLNQKPRGEISSEDMENVIDLTLGSTASKEEVNIFKGIAKFKDTTVKQIMRNRHDVEGIDYNWTFEQVRKQVLETGFSRLPVYSDNLDDVRGIIHSKDLLAYIHETDFDWHPLMRPVNYVHETKLIKPLMKEFQLKRNHIAIVVDEFGGTSGIVTLEDIMEEIIGEIKDEFDDDELLAKKIDDFNYIFEGKTLINDFCRVLAIPVDTFEPVRGESNSLAGLVLEIAGKFPAPNEVVRFDSYEFTVVQMERTRIQKIKVCIKQVVENNLA
jgi:putative hemolysin